MSSRALIYRFGLNKTSAEQVYRKLISAGVLYSKERSGYYITGHDKSLFESKTKKYDKKDVKTYFNEDLYLSNQDLENIKMTNKKKINKDDYFSVVKEYYAQGKLASVILTFFKKDMLKPECKELIQKGIFLFLSYNGKIITNKYYIFDDSHATTNNYHIIDDKDVHYKHTEVMIDIDGKIPCIVKNYDLDRRATVHQIFNRKIM